MLYLLKTDGRAGGAVACQKGELLEIQAGAVVLATGGSGQAFKRNMNPADVTGDGYAMAYEDVYKRQPFLFRSGRKTVKIICLFHTLNISFRSSARARNWSEMRRDV